MTKRDTERLRQHSAWRTGGGDTMTKRDTERTETTFSTNMENRERGKYETRKERRSQKDKDKNGWTERDTGGRRETKNPDEKTNREILRQTDSQRDFKLQTKMF